MVPVNVALGVNVIIPVVVFTVANPGDVPKVKERVLGFIGPPDTLQTAQTDTGVLTPVVVTIGFAIGGVPVTLTVMIALVQDTGNRLHTE